MPSYRAPSQRQRFRAAATLPLVLLALVLAAAPHGSLAQHSAGAQLQPQHGHVGGLTNVQHSAEHELPFAAADGVVTGAASGVAKADFIATAAGSRRTLLHGKRRPRDYSVCPRCTPITCATGTNTCSGHCKSNRALFTCKILQRAQPGCGEDPDQKPDPSTLPADPLLARRSVQVTAPAPYLGCANITGVPDGCPPAGTTGTLAGGGGATVLASWCVQHLYLLPCATGKNRNRTPFHPFGYCQCLMHPDSGAAFGGPCQTTLIDWSGPGDGDSVPVRVSTEGGQTYTEFGEREELDDVRWTLDHTFGTVEGRIDVKMRLYEPQIVEGYDIEEEGPLPGVEEEEEASPPLGDLDYEDYVELNGFAEEDTNEGPGGTAEGAAEEVEEEEEVEEAEDESALRKFFRGFNSS